MQGLDRADAEAETSWTVGATVQAVSGMAAGASPPWGHLANSTSHGGGGVKKPHCYFILRVL